MYLLSKLENIKEEGILEIKNALRLRMNIANKNHLLIKNPLHLNHYNSINFSEFNSIYEISTDEEIVRNDKLSELLKIKDSNEIKKMLTNSYLDESFANQFIKKIISEQCFDLNKIKHLIKAVSELIEKVYGGSDTSSQIISLERKILEEKSDINPIESLILYILKNRATRYSLFMIMQKLTQINHCIKLSKGNCINVDMLDFLINEKKYKIIFSEKKYNSICLNDNPQKSSYIEVSDSYKLLRFENMKNIKDKFNKDYLGKRYIYLEKNNVIITELTYLDCIQLTDGIEGLKKMLDIFNLENLNQELIDSSFINFIVENSLTEIVNLLIEKFHIYNDRLMNLNNIVLLNERRKQPSILEMINKNYA